MRAHIETPKSVRRARNAGSAAALMILALALAPQPAIADGAAATRTREAAVRPPVKDCTRVNGRVGYYANPWCTPAEQERWDRWEAARLEARQGRPRREPGP
jgi:hypothetical protein